MAKLSDEEERLMERLKAKREAPDPEPIGRTVHAHVDFGKKDQVEMARKYGFLRDDDDGGETKEGEGGGGEKPPKEGGGERPKDGTPRRDGYFT